MSDLMTILVAVIYRKRCQLVCVCN